MLELMETTGTMHNTGCKRDETKTLLKLANDVVENTNKRSISAAGKPKRRSLTQTSELSRAALMRLPSKMKPNHVRQEKRERPEQRLRLKIGSVFMQH